VKEYDLSMAFIFFLKNKKANSLAVSPVKQFFILSLLNNEFHR